MGCRATAVALLAALLAVAAAAAPPEDGDEPKIHTERRMSEFAPDALPTDFSPYHLMRAQAAVARAFEFFGDAEGFKLGSDLLVLEVEAGAALRMLDHMRVTASYRLLNVDSGQAQDSSVGLEPGLSAPFLGVAFDF